MTDVSARAILIGACGAIKTDPSHILAWPNLQDPALWTLLHP
jgi:hypothetical protein